MKCPKCGYDITAGDDVTKLFVDNWDHNPNNSAEKKTVAGLIEKYSYEKVEKAFIIAANQKKLMVSYVIGILKKQEEQEYVKKVRTEAAQLKGPVNQETKKEIGNFDFSAILKPSYTPPSAGTPLEGETSEQKEARRIKEKKFEDELLLNDPKAYREYMDKKKA